MNANKRGLKYLGFSCALLYTVLNYLWISVSEALVTSIVLSLGCSVSLFLILLSVFRGNRKLGFIAIFIEIGIQVYQMVASLSGNIGNTGMPQMIVGYLAPEIIFLVYRLCWLLVLNNKWKPKGIFVVTLILCTISASNLILAISTGSELREFVYFTNILYYAAYAIAAYELMKKDIIHNNKTPKNSIEAYKMSRQKSGGNQDV